MTTAYAPDNLAKPATEQVSICDKTEALGWDCIGSDSDRTTNVTITQKKHGFIATAAVGDFADSDNYQFIIPEDLAELTAVGDMRPPRRPPPANGENTHKAPPRSRVFCFFVVLLCALVLAKRCSRPPGG